MDAVKEAFGQSSRGYGLVLREHASLLAEIGMLDQAQRLRQQSDDILKASIARDTPFV
jgi:hypothetical protein